MSTVGASETDRPRRDPIGFPVLLLIATIPFVPTLVELAAYLWTQPEYSHGLLMPFVAGWLMWGRRRELAALPSRPSLVGALLLLPCLGALCLGEMKLSWFLKPYAYVGALGAVTWACYGIRGVRLVAPALVALLLMCPLPGRIQNALTLPLKNWAALFATGLLDLCGIPATLEGNVIHMPGLDDLWVADACSGIRSLIALTSLAIIACLVWSRPMLLKILVVLSAFPIAVLVNGLRIWATGVLSAKASPEAAQGFFHFFEGVALFAVALLLLSIWAALLARLFPKRAS